MRKNVLTLIGGVFLLVFLACEEDLITPGEGVIGGEPFVTDKAVFDVFAYNKKIEAIPTNKLPIYQLGNYNDPIYGKTSASVNSQVSLASGNPIFGEYSQSSEDNPNPDDAIPAIPENETVTAVTFYIPYLQNSNSDLDQDGVPNIFDEDPNDPNSDSDGDGLTDNQERIAGLNPLDDDTDGDGILDDVDEQTLANVFPRKVDLDSIYGDRSTPFTLKIERSTYFLRDLDPDFGFLEAQEYYSSQEFAPTFVSEVLFEGQVQISDEEFITFQEDDPETTDVNESELVDERLQPGVQVSLDPDFFQENIIDKEGQPELVSSSNFNDFIRGFNFSIGTDDDIMLLLNFTNARITIEYEYDVVNDGEIAREERTYELGLITGGTNFTPINGNAVNTLVNEPFPPNILDEMDSGQNASRIYLKAGGGSYAEVRLFDENNGEDAINQIKANNWVINEANLVFYVDREALDNVGGVPEPPRLYLYNAETNQPLFNEQTENSVSQSAFGLYLTYDGFLEEEDDKGLKYTVRITEYLNNIIVRDSTNATLGLMMTSDIRFTGTSNTILPGMVEKRIPVSSNISPLGTILIGSNVPETEDRKLKLEIFYTETN
ncbi:DUF4270 family protein [Flavobacteriaceae bacterium D16]|nr:DUF4270 family protein [Flavobacteriaceae bacterium D16]